MPLKLLFLCPAPPPATRRLNFPTPLSARQVDPKTDGAARDWVAIYDECSRILYEEIDYRKEGENATRFRENFKGQDWVKVPKVYWDYSTSKILTLEY